MPSKANLKGTTLPRRQLGRALRDARHAQGLTLESVGKDTEFSRSMLSRIELGQYEKLKVREIEYLCRYYSLPKQRTKYLMALASQASTTVWWQDDRHLLDPDFNTYLELESFATEFRFFQPLVIPGLLQTADYAKTLHRLVNPNDPPEEIDRRVEVRMQRHTRLMRQPWKVQAEFLLHESVLHTVVESNRVMAAQCRHIADVSTRENIAVRVIPFTAGFPTGSVTPPFVVLEFPDNEPSVVYTEAAIGSMTFEDTEDVERFHSLYETLRNAALEEQPSRDRIRKIARRYAQ